MRIDDVGRAPHSNSPGRVARPTPRPAPDVTDRVEISGRPPVPVDHSQVRVDRLQALQASIAAGRYHLPDDVLASAIVRFATGRYDRSV